MSSRGELFVLSAPSGAGKTSLVRALIASDPGLSLSVSHTTRPRRPGEVDGDHYHFVSRDTFEHMCREDGFLEHATVFGNSYGTARDEVQRHLEQGQDVLLEIDWQGARQIRTREPRSIGIFVLPPSVRQLGARLRARGQDDPAVIAMRMDAAVHELSHFDEFDYLVVNDDFQCALAQLSAIVTCRRLRVERQRQRHRALLAELLAGSREE